MQTEPANYRHRGWRQSADLVDLAKAVPCDLKDRLVQAIANEVAYTGIQGLVETLCTTRVAEIQHLRAQLHYRLKGNG